MCCRRKIAKKAKATTIKGKHKKKTAWIEPTVIIIIAVDHQIFSLRVFSSFHYFSFAESRTKLALIERHIHQRCTQSSMLKLVYRFAIKNLPFYYSSVWLTVHLKWILIHVLLEAHLHFARFLNEKFQNEWMRWFYGCVRERERKRARMSALKTRCNCRLLPMTTVK